MCCHLALELELKLFLSNNVRMSTATENVYCAIIIVTIAHIAATFAVVRMVNNDYDKFRSFSRFYMTLFWHRTCTYYLHGRADRFLVLVSNGHVAALSDCAYYQKALFKLRKLVVRFIITIELEFEMCNSTSVLGIMDMFTHVSDVVDSDCAAVSSV